MAGVTSTIITDALRSQAYQGVVDTTFRNDEVLGRFTIRPLTGGATSNRKMQYGSNTSVGAYNEGDAVGPAGSQSYLTAQWPVTYYRIVVSFTGHAQDQLRNGSPAAAFFDQLGNEFTTGVKDLRDKMSTDALGTGTTAPVGIQGIVSSSGTVAGVSRTTFTWFQAYEVAGSGTTVTLADIDSADRFARDADYASNYDQVWTSWKQVQKLRGAIGLAGTANNSIRQMSGGTIELSGNDAGVSYNGRPIIPIRDLTNSVFLGISSSELFLGLQRDLTTAPLAKVDDSDKWLVTMAAGIGCDNPKHNWKITGYTA